MKKLILLSSIALSTLLTSCSSDDNVIVHQCEPKTETLRVRVDTQDNILQVLNFNNAWHSNFDMVGTNAELWQPANAWIAIRRSSDTEMQITAAGNRRIKKIVTPAFPQVYDNLNETVFFAEYGLTQTYFDNTDVIEFFVTVTIE